MDRNSIIGLFLIGLILVTFNLFFLPDQPVKNPAEPQKTVVADSQAVENEQAPNPMAVADDSLQQIRATANFGSFAPFTQGERQSISLENEHIKVIFDSKGGRISQVQLKKYRTYDSLPLVLFNPEDSRYSYQYVSETHIIETDQLYFTPSVKDNKVSFRLQFSDNQYLEHSYSLHDDSYVVDHQVNLVGLNDLLADNIDYTKLNWQMSTPRQERDLKDERVKSDIYYKYQNDSPDYLNVAKSDNESLVNAVKWISFKQKFFSSTLIADQAFETAEIAGGPHRNESQVADFQAEMVLPIKHKKEESLSFQFYFGPNHFKTLKTFELGLEKQVPLGWGIFGWVNRFIVIPVFNWLDSFNLNYGLIILLLTIVIKLILMPFTYKSYLSTAKMRVLKPEIDELKAKYEKEPQKVQAEQMKLFQKAGVNPLGGCLPLLLQLPILIALFNFFPASIELRQQAFLWADDLSTYDSIWTFGHVPLINTIYGDHISLFTILMTISTLIYTRINNQISGVTGQMKVLSYIMPLMFLGIMNNYSAALSYYYFLANMITFGQQWIIRRFVDDDAIHRKIQENKKKPVKKSRFQARLEEMSKAAQQKQQQRKK
jgi:YidC/Oxa1 family membrane protein insertase